MLSWRMPGALVKEKGYYPVGGCGANIAWHTEDDTLEIADRDNLLRDMRVYAASVLRALNAPVAPFDYRATIDEMNGHLADYQQASGDAFDFGPTRVALANVRATLNSFYQMTASIDPSDTTALVAANRVQRALARELVTVSYTR